MQIISGHSHSFDVGIARSLGLHCAIIFNHIVYWLNVNAAKGHNIRDGKVWMYETQAQIAEFLDYLTIDQVRKAMLKLLDSEIIIKGYYNSNPLNRTAWYTVCDQNLIKIKKNNTKLPNGNMHDADDVADSQHATLDSAICIYEQKEHSTNKKPITNNQKLETRRDDQVGVGGLVSCQNDDFFDQIPETQLEPHSDDFKQEQCVDIPQPILSQPEVSKCEIEALKNKELDQIMQAFGSHKIPIQSYVVSKWLQSYNYQTILNALEIYLTSNREKIKNAIAWIYTIIKKSTTKIYHEIKTKKRKILDHINKHFGQNVRIRVTDDAVIFDDYSADIPFSLDNEVFQRQVNDQFRKLHAMLYGGNK